MAHPSQFAEHCTLNVGSDSSGQLLANISMAESAKVISSYLVKIELITETKL